MHAGAVSRTAMHRSRRILPPLLLLLLGLSSAALWWHRRDGSPGATGTRLQARPAPPTQAMRTRTTDPDLAGRILELESQRSRRMSGEWRAETEAQSHEELFIQLWDRLRTEADPIAVLAALPFRRLEIPVALESRPHDPGVQVLESGKARDVRDHGQWVRMLEGWAGDGWRLEGSEWRMPRFQPADGARPARSGHVAEFFLRRIEPPNRRHLVVEFDVTWGSGTNPEDAAVPDGIVVTGIHGTGSALPPRFERVAADRVDPVRGFSQSDPLIVRDLDGDGRDEIVLLGKNRVYLNRGPGRIQGVRLCPRLDSVPATGLVVDVTGDGIADVVAADGRGLLLVEGTAGGRFDGEPRRQDFPDFRNPWVMTAGDVDADGDLDLWLAQYKVPYLNGQMPHPFHDANDGFPSLLLRNDGHGGFTDVTEAAGLAPKRFRRTYSTSFVDLDQDGDLDLLNVSDFAGVDLYLNDGSGRFVDATERLPDPHLFGMAHAVADFDNDGQPDVLAIGMNSPVADRLDSLGLGLRGWEDVTQWRKAMAAGNRLWLGRNGRFEVPPWSREVAATGWSWGVAAQDFDHDGDLDLWIANGHKSRASARDYETEFWTSDIYQVRSTALSPALDHYFQGIAGQRYGRGDSYGGHQHNRFLQRGSDGRHVDTAWIHGVALEQDCRNVSAADLDLDGRLDLVVTTASHEEPFTQTVEIFRGTGPATNWVALRVPDLPGGFPASGVSVELEATGGRQTRWLLTGDGYRTQGWPVAWFGLPGGSVPKRFVVLYPGRRTKTLENPPANAVSVLR
jgi:enediyne biosynthesis protein E4